MSLGARLAAVAGAALLALGAAGGTPPIAEDPSCPRWRAAFAAMPERTVTLEAGSRRHAVRVKVAETGEQQAGGFQCATPEQIDRHLVLFDFGSEIQTQFHMQNVPAPLDIAFIKADGRLFSILVMAPSRTKLYGPMGRFRYALEARKGWYEAHGIRQGEARLVPAPGP